jgi:hypothetical protein
MILDLTILETFVVVFSVLVKTLLFGLLIHIGEVEDLPDGISKITDRENGRVYIYILMYCVIDVQVVYQTKTSISRSILKYCGTD